MVNVSFFCEITYFCIVVAIRDLVHDMETIHGLFKLLTASGSLFCNMSDARKTAIQFCVNWSLMRNTIHGIFSGLNVTYDLVDDVETIHDIR